MGQFNSKISSIPIERTVVGLHDYLFKSVYKIVNAHEPVLDIGCGSGAWLKRLSDEGFDNLTGIDIDIKQVAINSGTFKRVNIDKCGSWDLPKQKYALITAIEVIEHLTNIGHLLSEASKLLKPKGFILITSPNIHSIACRLRFLFTGSLKQFGSIGDSTHLFPVIIDSFPRVIDKYGLELIKSWGYPKGGETLTSRRFANTVTSILRRSLPELIPGDTLCMLMQKKDS